MEILLNFFQFAGLGLIYLILILLCLVALVLSSLSISGTWLVSFVAVIVALLRGFSFPGWGTIIVFLVLSGIVEVAEGLAGAWGVTKRGGSGFAGFMAIVGGILGMILGGFIPVPIIGSLLGMMAGSFLLVFLVERKRLADGKAADIAMGAVIARVLIVVLKVLVTLGMVVFLLGGLIVSV
jgi:uncharacterized protein YqgC (DUF456 family)